MTPPSECPRLPCCGLPYHAWDCRNNEHRVENLRQVLLCEIDWAEIGSVIDLTPDAVRVLLDEAVRRRVEAGF